MPTRKATKTTKTKAEAKPRKSPFTIDEEISFGQIRTGDNKADEHSSKYMKLHDYTK